MAGGLLKREERLRAEVLDGRLPCPASRKYREPYAMTVYPTYQYNPTTPPPTYPLPVPSSPFPSAPPRPRPATNPEAQRPSVVVFTTPSPVTRVVNPALGPRDGSAQLAAAAASAYTAVTPYTVGAGGAATANPSRTVETVTDLLALLHPSLYFNDKYRSADGKRQGRVESRSRQAILVPCPQCYATVLTELRVLRSAKSVLWSMLCCLAPCVDTDRADREHICPNCRFTIARYVG